MRRNANLNRSSGTHRPDVRPDHDRKIQNLVTASMEGHSRKELARSMTEFLSWEVTPSMLDNFSSGAKVTARFPASLVSAFCDACHDDRLRFELMGPRLRHLVTFAEKVVAAAHNRRQLRDLIDFMRDSLSAGADRKELRALLDELLVDERKETP